MIFHTEGLLLSCAVAETFKARPQITHFAVAGLAGKRKKKKCVKRVNACENRKEVVILHGQGNCHIFTFLVPVKLGSPGWGKERKAEEKGHSTCLSKRHCPDCKHLIHECDFREAILIYIR